MALGGISIGLILLGSLIDVGRHIRDAQNEGEGKVGRGQLLCAALGEVAVLEIVLVHRAHGMDVTEAAVVVRQHEAVGRYHLARTTAAEDADTLAQRRRRLAVKRLGRELQAGLAQRILQMLLLHQF